MDEVITCPTCGGQTWVIGTSGTRCAKCDWWLMTSVELYSVADGCLRHPERKEMLPVDERSKTRP